MAQAAIKPTHPEPTGIGYTPGPWTYAGEVKSVGDPVDMLWCGAVTPVRAIGEYRGEIAMIQSCDHIRGITRKEAAANAKLISALPDLVDALQEAREFIDNQVDVVDGSYGEPAPNRAMTLARLIDSALARAGV